MKMKPNFVAEKDAIRDSRNIYHCIMLPLVYTKIVDLDYEICTSKEPISFEKMKKRHFRKIKKEQSWGKELFDCAWFHVDKDVKDLAFDIETTYLAFDVNGEGLLVDDQGEPIKGFTNGSSVFDRNLGQPGKVYYPIKNLLKDKKLDLYFDCGYNDLFGNIQENGKVKEIALVTKDEEMATICYDFDVLLTLLENIDRKHPYFQVLFDGVTSVRDLFWFQQENAKQRAKDILDYLLSIKVRHFEAMPTFYSVGHAHLDLAWLWPIRESKRKAVRTLANVFYLLEKYPDFHFVISQPQQMIWIQEHSQKMFEELKKYEKEGRIEIVGGGFVEFDTNVSGEEQLARQMLYGQKFYLENFGHYVNNLWLPDTFGYNGNLPQIIRQGGMDYFMTIKISWNRFNAFPYHDFIWQGIDGSSVLAHLPPEGTYNSGASAKSVLTGLSKLNKKEMKYDALMIYGIGDGGGGPGEGHVENLARISSLMGLPPIRQEKVTTFFSVLEKQRASMPTYKGELYLENHNGTYTSQSFNKKYNRKMEEKLKRLELFLASRKITKYNRKIDELYRRTLLLEFHDILPGSSIQRVYVESKKEYLAIEKEIDKIFLRELPTYLSEYKADAYVYNHLNYPVTRTYKFENAYYRYSLNQHELSNHCEVYYQEKELHTNEIETEKFKIHFHELGYMDSIIDKTTNRELVLNGANRLWVFQDHGDAWNILDNYRNQLPVLMTLKSRKMVQYGKIIEVKSVYTFKNSTVEETMIIDDSNLIHFQHKTHWNDEKYLLASNFNLAISSQEATCDIQFGKIKRTRRNETLVEKAQYEICAQQFVDVSDEQMGVSLINKTKCGYYIKDHDLELHLLRSTTHPCVHGDIGDTDYEYALYIHQGNDVEASVDKVAYIFNSDFIMSQDAFALDIPFEMDNDDLEYSCLKTKYHGKGLIIRIYERDGKKTKLDLRKTSLRGKKVSLVNFIEEVVEENVQDQVLSFYPYEVKTLWVK